MTTTTETRLNLLCRDGALAVTFQGGLTAEQAAQLISLSTSADDTAQLRTVVTMIAKEWGIGAVVDPA